MKKIFSMLMVVALAVGFVGCGSDKKQSKDDEFVSAYESITEQAAQAVKDGDFDKVKELDQAAKDLAEKYGYKSINDLPDNVKEKVEAANEKVVSAMKNR